jgi:hypothetical protein
MAALIQQVPGQKPAESALGNIAEHGILGSICVLLIVAVFFTIRALLREKDRRFSDQQALLQVVEKHNEAVKDLAIEATKSQAELQNALTNQVTSLDRLQTEFSKAMTEGAVLQGQVKEALSQFRKETG